jgi:hypothetical protein
MWAGGPRRLLACWRPKCNRCDRVSPSPAARLKQQPETPVWKQRALYCEPCSEGRHYSPCAGGLTFSQCPSGSGAKMLIDPSRQEPLIRD